jgi:hypothetical protein
MVITKDIDMQNRAILNITLSRKEAGMLLMTMRRPSLPGITAEEVKVFEEVMGSLIDFADIQDEGGRY